MKITSWPALAIALGLAGIGVLETFDWAKLIPDTYEGPALIAIGLVFAFVRNALGKKTA